MTTEVSPITGGTIEILTDSATVAWDASKGFAYSLTLGGDHTLANPTGLVAGTLYMLSVAQDGTGTRILSYGALFRFPAAVPPILSTAAGAIDYLLFYSDGTSLNYLSIVKNNQLPVTAPSGLTASTDETGQVTLHWVDHSADETAFVIERDDGLGFGEITTVSPNVTTYTDAVITPGDYPYRVRARRDSANSSYTNTAVGTAV